MAYTAVDDSGANHSTIYYVGDNSNPRTLTGGGFQPDMTWIKNASQAYNHILFDSVRGAGSGKSLCPAEYYAENVTVSSSTYGFLSAFTADGFSVDTGTSSDVYVNDSSAGPNYVGWNWKGGTTTGIDTTGSTITPTGYSFNAAAGFSVIEYTGNASAGALVPHGLGAIPDMIIVKNVDSGQDWRIYHHYSSNLGGTPQNDYMVLNTNVAKATNSTMWNDTAPTSVNFSLGTAGSTNGSGEQHMAYCFKGIQGFSRFAWYYGNNTVSNENGRFVYTGFRPAWIMLKSSSATGNWSIYDDKRLGYNSDNNALYAQADSSQDTSDKVNFCSNGFKFIDTGDPNADEYYVYAAFAQSPLVNSEGVPNNAR